MEFVKFFYKLCLCHIMVILEGNTVRRFTHQIEKKLGQLIDELTSVYIIPQCFFI